MLKLMPTYLAFVYFLNIPAMISATAALSSFMETFIIPYLSLRLLPVLNGSTFLTSSLFVDFIGSLGNLQRQIDGCGFRCRLRFGFWA